MQQDGLTAPRSWAWHTTFLAVVKPHQNNFIWKAPDTADK